MIASIRTWRLLVYAEKAAKHISLLHQVKKRKKSFFQHSSLFESFSGGFEQHLQNPDNLNIREK